MNDMGGTTRLDVFLA